MRDIVVLVRQSKYDGENEKFLTKYQQVNVMVGPKTVIDKVKPKLDEFVSGFGGSFTTVDRVQAF